jgi:aspartate ammonia-lyase
MSNTRTEHDLLGDREIPAEAYYGVHTLRAKENFQITGQTIASFPELVIASSCRRSAMRSSPRAGKSGPVHCMINSSST